jgi:hypothetical protein
MHIVVQQELLQHLPRRAERVKIAPLAPELEREVAPEVPIGCTNSSRVSDDILRDHNLVLPFHALGEGGEVWRGADMIQIRMCWDCHVSFEGDVILKGYMSF